jgi:putative ABC transport system permease protein
MGASVFTITQLIAKEFLWLVAIGFVIAIPIGYYFLGKWLTGFAYRIGLHAFFFFAAAVIVLLIAAIAISYNAIRAANRDPVKALKYE